MQVAAVQFTSGADKADNRARIDALVGAAAGRGARLVVAPEASMHEFGRAEAPLAPIAEPLDGPFVSALLATASTYGVTVVAGMFETVAGDAALAYNTVVVVDPDGSLVGRYRKIHLFDALGHLESNQLATAPVEPLTFGCEDLTVGVLTCYDLRFPELARALVSAGATVLAVPAAWVAGPEKIAQWSVLLRARAIENTAYVIGAGQGPDEYAGHSAVVDPYGVVLTELADTDDVAVAEVSVARLADVRQRMPSLEHRRL